MIKAQGTILLATLLVAGSFISADYLSQYYHPVLLTWLRFVLAALLLVPFVAWQPNAGKQCWALFPKAALISLFYCGFFIAMFAALEQTSTLNTASIYTLIPLLTACLCFVFYRQKMLLQDFVLYLFGAICALWVIFDGDWQKLQSFSFNPGDKLFFVGCLSMGAYAASLRLVSDSESRLLMTFAIILMAVVWLSLALWAMSVPLALNQITSTAVWHLIYLVVGTTLLTLYLYQKATLALGPKRVVAYVYLNPILVAVLDYLFNQQAINIAVLPAVLGGVAVTCWLQRQKRA
ncbi:DMT family transporter [Gayadomonas joobiniege]|uniref:DMT family transporter n=1 Tax=Gayadomonas joobiniege TaxID=1234606 RepID=UPI00035DECF7|nr:DMT family transporter [Gayadomonas joobiniege]